MQSTVLPSRLAWCLTLLLLAGLSGAARAQQRPAPFFTADVPAARAAAGSPLRARLREYRAYTLDLQALRTALAAAPLRGGAATAPLVISLPLPDGTAQRFTVWEAPLLAPALAAQYPTLHTYGGRGLDDPTALLSLTVSPSSCQAQVLSDQPQGAAYLEMTSPADATHYLSYYAHDVTPPAGGKGGCGTDLLPRVPQPARRQGGPSAPGTSNLTQPIGPALTVYRLIVTTTKEYTNGRSNTDVMADVTAQVNNVRTIQERDLAVTMTLVGTHFYQVGADGGYNQGSDAQMIDQNRSNVEAEFGASSYDLGHLFATSGSGLAYVGVVGNPATGGAAATYKAGAVSGNFNRTTPASYFATSVIAHEMGHQFSATHTFSNNQGACSPFPTTSAWEPGKGSTIMAYTDAGCDSPSNNVIQARSDDYYHTGSVEQMRNYIESIPSVGTKVASGNTAPTVAVPANRTIPQGTPFRLAATGADADAADALKYTWEELDLGTAANLNTPQTANNNVPLFRSVLPSLGGNVRYFPALSNYNGVASTSAAERLPTVARVLTLRCTVRDNHAVSGAVAANTNSGVVGGVTLSPAVTLTVSAANATPFAVTAPNTAVTWAAGSTQSVTWNGVGTKTSVVNCQTVNVRLSTDGGLSYPTLLAAGVPNADGTGTATITVPNVASSTARIMVEAADNYFFDVSDANFAITAAPAGPAIAGFSPASGPASSTVVITGAGFSGATAVRFGGVAASFVVNSDSQITATVPATALTGAVAVTSGGLTVTGGVFQVTPVLTAVVPSAGPVGASVVVSGNSFGGATRVSFNGTETTTFTLDTSTTPNTLTVAVPVGATTGPLLVYTAGGASNSVLFTVQPFALSSLVPAPNARNVVATANVEATFNAAANPANSTTAPLKVSSRQYGGRKAGTTSLSSNTITFDPAADFKAGEVVQVSLTTAATSGAGAALEQSFVSQFTVASRATSGLKAANSSTVGTNPRGMATGDLNGDGFLDLVVANYNAGGPSTVSVLLNNGAGAYPAATTSTISTGIDAGAEHVLLADFNNDTNLDLVVVCTSSGMVDVLQGNGDGTFAVRTPLQIGAPGVPALGDLNGDGNLDLVVPNVYSNVGWAQVALGDGNLGFAISLYNGLANCARGVALADFNQDGRLDLVAATYIGGDGNTNGSVSIRRGTGTGSFLPATDATSQELSAPGALMVAVADFTGDGYPDVAVDRPYASNAPLSVWAGTASGSLNATPITTSLVPFAGGGQAFSLSTGDYDGDGRIDLLAPIANLNAGYVAVFKYAAGAFTGPTYLITAGGSNNYTATLGDLNNDDALDLAVPTSFSTSHTIQVALAVPTPLPVELTTFTATLVAHQVQVQWTTASEKNSQSFEVERSLDGQAFAAIGAVAAAGNSSATLRYNLLDDKLPAGAPLLYYRLKQIDQDGTFSYSPVRTLLLSGAATGLTLYPNPALHGVTTLAGAQPGAAVTVIDAVGRPVATATADATGTARLALPAGTPAGVYVVRAGAHALRLTVE